MGYYDGCLEKKDSLYHSDTYLGADFSDGIKHWKYIRKYKGKNGKWRYVYFNKAKKFIDTRVTGNAYKEEAEIAKAQAQAYQNTVDYQTQRLADYNKEYADNYIGKEEFDKLEYESKFKGLFSNGFCLFLLDWFVLIDLLLRLSSKKDCLSS